MASPAQSAWSQGQYPSVRPQQLTEFELTVERLGLTTFNEMRCSRQLEAWIRKHKDHYYVPEELLNYFQLDVKCSDC
jgi:hypothetical protein